MSPCRGSRRPKPLRYVRSAPLDVRSWRRPSARSARVRGAAAPATRAIVAQREHVAERQRDDHVRRVQQIASKLAIEARRHPRRGTPCGTGRRHLHDAVEASTSPASSSRRRVQIRQWLGLPRRSRPGARRAGARRSLSDPLRASRADAAAPAIETERLVRGPVEDGSAADVASGRDHLLLDTDARRHRALVLERHGGRVLERDAGRVEDGHLVVGLAALELPADHLADLAGDVVLGDQALAQRDVDLAVRAALADVVDEDRARWRMRGSSSCSPSRSAPSAAMCVPGSIQASSTIQPRACVPVTRRRRPRRPSRGRSCR